MAKTGGLATVETEIVEALRTKRQHPRPPIEKQLYRMEELVGMGFGCRAAIYKRIHDGRFPPPIRLGPRSVAWTVSSIEQFVAARVAERDREHTVASPSSKASARTRAGRFGRTTPRTTPVHVVSTMATDRGRPVEGGGCLVDGAIE